LNSLRSRDLRKRIVDAIKLAGLKAIRYPPAIYYHYGSRTNFEALDRLVVPVFDFERNRAYYARKWGRRAGR